MKYAVATVTSTFRMRYVLSEEELQSLNTDVKLDDQKMVEWLEDTVTCEEVNEFSQKFLGEQIISTEIMDEDQTLKLFDTDNDYLADWSKEQKLDYLQKRLIQKDS
jgi:hypothetical protein